MTITTDIPADGPGEFDNRLDLAVELYDRDKILVASSASGQLTYEAEIGGLYTVRVLSESHLGEYTLQVAGYTGDTQAPSAVLAPVGPITGSEIETVEFTIRYTDSVAVNRNDFDDLDIRVTGPNNFDAAARFVRVEPTDSQPWFFAVVYGIDAPDGTWSEVDNGVYTVWMEPNQIGDTSANYVPPGELGTFDVAVPKPDLYESSLSIDFSPDQVHPGDPVNLNWTVANNDVVGIPENPPPPRIFGPAYGPWDEGVFLSTDAIWDADDILLGTATFTGVLQPSGSHRFSEIFQLPDDISPGVYHVITFADYVAGVPSGRVEEANEGNNWNTALGTLEVVADGPLTIDIGNHVLLPNTPNQEIEVYVTGADEVEGLELFVQVADGGPEAGGVIDGPAITHVDIFTNTIFAENNTGEAGGGSLMPQFWQSGTTTHSGTVLADGLLATVTIDTTGFFAGDLINSRELRLIYTLMGDSSFPGATSTQIINGTITFDSPESLGPVSFHDDLKGLDPSVSDLWYSLETTRKGFLTIEAVVEGSADSVTLTLYDENFTELATSSVVDGSQRIDHLVSGIGEKYYFSVSGSNSDVALRLANLVHHDSTTVTVHGTDGDDTFTFTPTGSHQVTINGVAYHFDDTEVNTVQFDGGDGHDEASLEDSSGNDVYTVTPDYALMETPDFTVRAESVSVVHAYARNGGTDTAVFIDSPGNDKVKAEDGTTVKMYSSNRSYYNRAKFFETVQINFSQGGAKADARLWDSPASDIFDGRPGNVRYYSEDTAFDVTVLGADFVTVYSTHGGNDTLILHDSPGDDVFRAKTHKVELFDRATGGKVHKITARNFKNITAYADNTVVDKDGYQGGYDIAKLYDSALDDLWEAEYRQGETWSTMASANRALYTVLGFERVKGYSVNGGTNTLRKRSIPPEIDFVLTHGDWLEV